MVDVLSLILGSNLGQYKDDPQVEGILTSLANEIELVIQALMEFMTLEDLDLCSGVLLDMWGMLCEEPRGTKTDAQYRKVLKLIFQNPISGTPDEILKEMSVRNNDAVVSYTPMYPAAFWLFCNGSNVDFSILNRYSPAGVGWHAGCNLALSTGEDFLLSSGNPLDTLWVDGPCPSAAYPEDREWDGGAGVIQSDSAVFKEAWPFLDGTGIGQQPDGGENTINPDNYKFIDGSFADAMGT